MSVRIASAVFWCASGRAQLAAGPQDAAQRGVRSGDSPPVPDLGADGHGLLVAFPRLVRMSAVGENVPEDVEREPQS
jgi:hypothetical protein